MTVVNILIVDDKADNIVTLEAILKRNDIRLFSATSSNDALKLAWENHISIALIDVQMPGMNGFELVEVLKSNARTKDIMVIFVTAISKKIKFAAKGFGIGAIDYLYKPLDPYITSSKVDSFIQLARYQANLRAKNTELENLEVVLQNSADVICIIDIPTYTIQKITAPVEKMTGYKPADLVGKTFIDLAIEEQKQALRKKLSMIIRDEISFSAMMVKFQTIDKRVVSTECRVAYHNQSLFININSATAKPVQEPEPAPSKENNDPAKKVKETFLANMSHELRTPVNGIIGLTQLLRETHLTEQQTSMINLLEVSSQSLLGVINDVLDISKIESGKFRIVRSANNLGELVQSVYDLLKFKADENNVEFLMDISPNVPATLIVDSLRLKQILMNLLSNAIKFTEGGYVKLIIAPVERTSARVRLKISVEDSGIGIHKDKLSAIFDSFEQAEDDTANKYGGTGLGLTIVKKLVELKGGELSVASELGKGSVFTFVNWYDIAATPNGIVNRKSASTLKPFENVSVLVAEDNLVNQFMLSKILKDWKIEVEMVDNGRKALDKLLTKSYDLVLMDTHMPEMNGYETARAIRMDLNEPQKSVPIISLSAAAFEFEQQEAIDAGMNDVLSKPFQPVELYRKIQRLLKVKEVLIK